MKHGFRKPSLTKSIAARTVGKAKRDLMRSIFPSYGTRGMGIFHPIRSAYNKLYKNTTFGINDITSNKAFNSNSYNTRISSLKTFASSYNSMDNSIRNLAKNLFWKYIDELNNTKKIEKIVILDSFQNNIQCIKQWESKYNCLGKYSNEMEEFLILNKSKMIHDFLDRCYNATYEKIISLKTTSAKTNRYIEFQMNVAACTKVMDQENVEYAELLCEKLKNSIKYS